MSGLFVGLLKARRAFAPKIGVQQRATYIHGKPPKHKISVMESVFAMTVLTLAVLGPSGWILSQIEHYKKRD